MSVSADLPFVFPCYPERRAPQSAFRRHSFQRAWTALFASALILNSIRLEAQQPTDTYSQLQSQLTASPTSPVIPHRFLVAYTQSPAQPIPGPVESRARVGAALTPGTRILHVHPSLGLAVVQSDSSLDDATTIAQLRAQPGVETVVHDLFVSAHTLHIRPDIPSIISVAAPAVPYDTDYTSPFGWAVRNAGGLGRNIDGGTAPGPWNVTLGAGIRIAILDSGVDPSHPDLAPNLALNLSEVDQSPYTGVPSPCDNGSPVDQTGHGTWTASLAAAALGPGTGLTVGVAPQASILNIKVLERLPDPSSTASDIATRCATGEAGGTLSWVIQGIADAIAHHADVISLSLGSLVDLQTGEGAGQLSLFNRVTHAAFTSGAVLVASAGNSGLDLSNPRYVELPAEARDVLAVVASTNPDCAEDLKPGALCTPGPVTLPYYSNYGAPLNAIAAPGGSYPVAGYASGWITGACASGLPNTADGPPTDSVHSFGCFSLGHTPYVQAIGTSASAPLVAGAAALVRAANPAWTPTQIVNTLRNNALHIPSLPAAPLINPQLLQQGPSD